MAHCSEAHRVLGIILWPFSAVYRIGFALYRALYRWGVAPVNRFTAAVVSVGNITLGGTGKTPFVIFLFHLFSGRGRKIAIVSRGYGRRSAGGILDLMKQECIDSGDEPWLISLRTGAAVIVAHRKPCACSYAIETYDPDILILDDGFQSFSIHRDMDIVLIDASNFPCAPFLIPAGKYREELSALQRADAVILTRCDQSSEKAVRMLEQNIRKVKRTIALFRSSHETIGLVSTPEDEPSDPSMIKGKRIVAVSAIGNNRSFLRSLSQLGCTVVQSHSYRDHHRYRIKDINVLSEMVAAFSADAVITTEKDLYTLRSFSDSLPVPLYALSIRIKLDDCERFIHYCERKGIL